MKKVKYCMLFLILVLLSSCGEKQTSNKDSYRVYYLNNKQTKIEYYKVDVVEKTVAAVVSQLLDSLGNIPSKLEYTVPLGMNFTLKDVHYNENCLTMNFSNEYYDLSSTTEVLVRAAIVRTLTQVDGIDYINILVEDTPLIDDSGNLVGMISANQFIDYAEKEKSELIETEITLYFADVTGTELIKVSRVVENKSNRAMEKLIMEELIQGPQDMGGYPTLNPNIKVLSVSIQDSVCYVNFDEKFLTQMYNVSSDVTIYSIVNSLVELTGINQVQILIDGKTEIKYREKIDLNTLFERNYSLVH